MKKTLLLLSSLLVLSGISPVFAEESTSSEAIEVTEGIEVEDEFEPTEYETVYEADVYKIGVDMPEGIYKVFAIEEYARVEINNDARGEDRVAYMSVDTFAYFEAKDGQFVEITECFAVPIEEVAPAKIEGDIAGPGVYRIGVDIEPGEYKVKAIGEYARYEINEDPNAEERIDYGSIEKSNYVDVREGEFLTLTEAEIIIK